MCFFNEIPSTNQHAPAQQCAYALVVAKHQTRGRGRQQRIWHSNEESSLTFSFYHQQSVASLSPLWQIAVANTMADALPGLRLKWPNDLLYANSDAHFGKCGGILVESDVRGDTVRVVTGIGLNIRPVAVSNDDYAITHYPFSADPNEFIANIANRLFEATVNIDDTQIARFNAHHLLHKQQVQVENTTSCRHAIVDGLNHDARLHVTYLDNQGEARALLDQNSKVRWQ